MKHDEDFAGMVLSPGRGRNVFMGNLGEAIEFSAKGGNLYEEGISLEEMERMRKAKSQLAGGTVSEAEFFRIIKRM